MVENGREYEEEYEEEEVLQTVQQLSANGCLQCGPGAFGGVGVAVPWLLANVRRVRCMIVFFLRSKCMVYGTRSRYGLHVGLPRLACHQDSPSMYVCMSCSVGTTYTFKVFWTNVVILLSSFVSVQSRGADKIDAIKHMTILLNLLQTSKILPITS